MFRVCREKKGDKTVHFGEKIGPTSMHIPCNDQNRLVPVCCDVLHKTLADIFDTSFSFWAPLASTDATSASVDNPHCVNDMDYSKAKACMAIQMAMQSNKPQFEKIGSNRVFLALPVVDPSGNRIIGGAEFPEQALNHVVGLSRQLMRTWALEGQLKDLEQERELLLHQVTADLEELSLLRSIAELLTMSEMTWTIGDVAESVLPRLQYCTAASQIVLLPATEGKGVGTPVATVGKNVLRDEACVALVEHHVDELANQPLVVNDCGISAPYMNFSGLRCFVIVSLTRSDKTFGWILAVNRESTGYDCPGEPLDSKNLTQFGTRQATLLASAASILATHASNVELFRTKEQHFTDLVRALVRAIEAKDRYTRGHSERVGLYGLQIARALRLPPAECQRIYLAGLLHDVGKINIPEQILRNPSRLSADEIEEMKKHPDHGWGILQGLEGLQDVLRGVVYHHEHWNGEGYPDHLAGEEIPLESRILAVADAFDAMTSDRPYRKGMPVAKALAILREGAGSQWDPTLIDLFVQLQPEIAKIRDTHKLKTPAKRQSMTLEPEPLSDSPSSELCGAVSETPVGDLPLPAELTLP